MAASVTVELDVPKDWTLYRLPKALDARLLELLDRQNRDGKLSPREKREATALVDLATQLAVLKTSARVVPSRRKR